MSEGLGKGLRITIVAAGIAALAACATPAPPPPPPPPPPPAQGVVIPPRPLPTVGAVDHMTIPAHGMDGRYLTVNTGISSAQTLWNLRSGLNVAALNCQGIEHAAMDSRYGASVYAAYGPGYQAAAQPVVQLDAQYRQAASGGGIEPTDPPASGPVDSSRNPN